MDDQYNFNLDNSMLKSAVTKKLNHNYVQYSIFLWDNKGQGMLIVFYLFCTLKLSQISNHDHYNKVKSTLYNIVCKYNQDFISEGVQLYRLSHNNNVTYQYFVVQSYFKYMQHNLPVVFSFIRANSHINQFKKM